MAVSWEDATEGRGSPRLETNDATMRPQRQVACSGRIAGQILVDVGKRVADVDSGFLINFFNIIEVTWRKIHYCPMRMTIPCADNLLQTNFIHPLRETCNATDILVAGRII